MSMRATEYLFVVFVVLLRWLVGSRPQRMHSLVRNPFIVEPSRKPINTAESASRRRSQERSVRQSTARIPSRASNRHLLWPGATGRVSTFFVYSLRSFCVYFCPRFCVCFHIFVVGRLFFLALSILGGDTVGMCVKNVPAWLKALEHPVRLATGRVLELKYAMTEEGLPAVQNEPGATGGRELTALLILFVGRDRFVVKSDPSAHPIARCAW